MHAWFLKIAIVQEVDVCVVCVCVCVCVCVYACVHAPRLLIIMHMNEVY